MVRLFRISFLSILDGLLVGPILDTLRISSNSFGDVGIAMGVWVSGGISGGHINPAVCRQFFLLGSTITPVTHRSRSLWPSGVDFHGKRFLVSLILSKYSSDGR